MTYKNNKTADELVMKNYQNKGFTLVELSIVLVIIGLIISSVLVGQDLVRAAEIRATVSQYEQFNAATGAFKVRYNGLPGDTRGAANFGFVGDGNANGVLNQATANEHDGEYVFFWNHLGSGSAELISGSYLGTATGVTITNINSFTPTSKLTNNWGVYSVGSTNYYILGATTSNVGNNYTTVATINPLDAKSIDDKIDDGRPARGIVQARGANNTTPDTVPSYDQNSDASACTGGTAAALSADATYNTAFKQITCTLRFKMSIK